jgi:SAM-dependent methyltransferase
MENKYFSNIRKDLISLINKKEVVNALEIGGGDFDTLKFIVDKYKCKGTGLDIRTPKNVNNIKFYQCDLDNIDKSKLEFIQKFDLIIAGDVLEHTINPDRVCQFLNTILDENGIFILSVPNIRSIRALYWIFIAGTFPREQSGLFDKTHRSWFTHKNITDILNETGFEIIEYKPLGRLQKYFFGKKSILSEFLALQHSFVVKKKSH